MALHWKIMIGLVFGLVSGLIANFIVYKSGGIDSQAGVIVKNIAGFAEIIGQVFLRLIFMVVVPLVFCALSLGIVGIGDVRKLGRLGARTFLLAAIFSTIAVGIGLLLANVIQPGARLSQQAREDLRTRYATGAEKSIEQASKAKSLKDTLLDIIPKNPLQEAVGALDGSSPGNGIIGVMTFAVCFGIALSTIGEKAQPVVAFLEGVYEAVMVIIAFAMRLAPYGVCGLMFALSSLLGIDVLKSLAWYVVTVVIGLGLHLIIVYSLFLVVFAKRNPLQFFKDISEVILTSFASSSSNATLPTSMRVANEKLNLRRDVSSFVLTVGSTANQNGTALYEGMVVLFLAQVFGVELTLPQQLYVIVMATVAGIGTAGVPGGSLPLVVLVLQQLNIPAESIGIILGVDRLLDMSRTTVNVVGDLTIATCVDRWEGEPHPIDAKVSS